MRPNFDDLKYFLEVANTRNLSRAAERQGITQPSISAAMKRLESSLNTTILLRNSNGVQLTKAGETLRLQCQKFLSDWENIKLQVNRADTELMGSFTLGCHPSVALYTLPKLLPHLRETLPHISFNFKHDLSRKITEQIVSFELDFGLVINPTRHPDLVIRPILKDRVCLWRSKHTKTDKAERGESQNRQTLIYDPNLKQSQEIIRQLKSHSFHFMHSNNLEVIAALIESGEGIGILPSRVAQCYSDTLVEVTDCHYQPIRDELCLVYRADFQNLTISSHLGNEIKHVLTETETEAELSQHVA
ncbi:LysR family transcriptional regulator [Aestuariibacter sp. AA17]|uniref:LysR family transcriptional regulator n=1 Tax=Fluctibacter corallii TaxID=2984329 RepID=A0ABT3A3W4_9ALTE|nr:LysR family transcriptional regulator [Aestuariibacter sp. AA17]MCV2883310.1 LysR family transcriptional regulator [Aestuariibacter sp. AA17]